MKAETTTPPRMFSDAHLIRSYSGIADRSCFALSPDRSTVLIRGYGMGNDFQREDFHVVSWHSDTGAAEERFLIPMRFAPKYGYFNYVYSLSISPDSQLCAAGLSANGAIALWDLRRGLELRRLRTEPDIGSVYCIAFSPDGESLAAGGPGGLAVLSSRTGRTLSWMEGSFSHFNQLSFTTDGTLILCGGNDNPLRLASVASGRVVARVSGISGIDSVAISHDSQLALAGCSDGTVHLCAIRRGKELNSWHQDDREQPSATVYTLAPAAAQGEAIIQLSKYTSVAFSPDSTRALTASRGGAMRLWDLSAVTEIARYTHLGEGIDIVSFLPDGRSALACCNDGAVLLWAIPG